MTSLTPFDKKYIKQYYPGLLDAQAACARYLVTTYTEPVTRDGHKRAARAWLAATFTLSPAQYAEFRKDLPLFLDYLEDSWPDFQRARKAKDAFLAQVVYLFKTVDCIRRVKVDSRVAYLALPFLEVGKISIYPDPTARPSDPFFMPQQLGPYVPEASNFFEPRTLSVLLAEDSQRPCVRCNNGARLLLDPLDPADLPSFQCSTFCSSAEAPRCAVWKR